MGFCFISQSLLDRFSSCFYIFSHEKHVSFHQKFPEKFAPDESASHPPLPVYFSNVCLRFLPVLDVVMHRFIEMPLQHVHQILEVILDHLSILYKFHGKKRCGLMMTMVVFDFIAMPLFRSPHNLFVQYFALL